jgi:hypothetical protein
MTATRRPTPTAARPATLTPREQAAILDRANALFIVAVSGRNNSGTDPAHGVSVVYCHIPDTDHNSAPIGQ